MRICKVRYNDRVRVVGQVVDVQFLEVEDNSTIPPQPTIYSRIYVKINEVVDSQYERRITLDTFMLGICLSSMLQ